MKSQDKGGHLHDKVRDELNNALKRMSVSKDLSLFAKQMNGEMDCTSSESGLKCLSMRPDIGIICISHEGLNSLRYATKLILDKKGKYFSEDPEKLRAILSNILCNLYCNPSSDKGPELDIELKKLLKVKNYVSYIPIFNLDHKEIIQIDSCFLYPRDYEIPSLQCENRPKMFEEFKSSKPLSGYDYLISEVKAEACTYEAATEIAYRKIGEIVRYFWFFNGLQVFSSAEKCDASMVELTINEDESSISSTFCWLSKKGFINPIKLAELDKNHGLNDIFGWLSKPAENDLHKKIRESMIWTGEALNDRENYHALLKMVIALESLLLDSDDNYLNKKQTVAERTAFILSKDVKGRIEVRDMVDNFFRIRNDIVHDAKRDIIRSDQIRTLHQTIINIIYCILFIHKFENLEGVRNYVDEQKFT